MWCCGPTGFATLTAAAQADVRRRLYRCGLAASLDHTLRLLYSAQEGGQRDIAHHLAQGAQYLPYILHGGAVPMLKPTAGCGSIGLDQGSPSSSSNSNSGGCREEGHQLGLMHTLSKRATVLGRALEAARATGMPGPGPEQGLGAGAGDQQQLLPFLYEGSARVLTALCAAMDRVQGEMGLGGAGAVQGTTVGAIRGEQRGGGTAPGPEAACVDQALDTLALASRAASHLVTSLAWGLAADAAEGSATAEEEEEEEEEEAQEEGEEGEEEEEAKEEGEEEGGAAGSHMQRPPHESLEATAVGQVLARAMHLWHEPSLLTPAQLLACQPHRLLAASCAMAAALPAGPVAACTSGLVAVLASRETLSSRVKGWLAPPPPPLPPAPGFSSHGGATGGAAGDGAGGGGSEAPDPWVGCLEAPIRAAMQQLRGVVQPLSVPALVLLKQAAAEFTPRQGWAGAVVLEEGAEQEEGGGEEDGGFRRVAVALAESVMALVRDPSLLNTQGADLAGLPRGVQYLLREGRREGLQPPSPPPSALPGALPPLLALPPTRAGALPRLRVCGNPRCGNFAERSEGALPFKQCGGCRAVRYCSKECQGAHWREGHRAACKAMAADEGA